MHNVVVTGYGVFTAFGFGAEVLRNGVFAGRPSFAEVSRFDTSRYHAKHAAEYPGEPAPSQMDVLRRCLVDALSMARHDGTDIPVLLGTNGDHSANLDFWKSVADGERPRDSGIVDGLPGRLPELLAREFGLGYPRMAFVNACIAGTNAVAYGAELISSGRADSVLCGGSFLVTEDIFAKFDSGEALAIDGAVRPFSKGRQGLLHGDGAAVLLLESRGHARRRGAEALGRVLGWGLAADGHHPIQPHPQGRGLAAAARAALRRAGMDARDIGYVNAHGTGTPRNDPAEAAALRQVFGERADSVPVSSTKSSTGHMLEATGAVEAVITLLALSDGLLPPTCGFLEADPECVVDCIPHTARDTNVSHALSLNAAFGGANAALVLGAP
ncbi:beta-ketoacyl-[acyl-carrier-protein] synthase family protein [Streptomyces sp. MB09-02B]|uniref:beta-ketoacyl-[acyl-carrier-protein] synthase family protein n=1 Tax=Streptomyces sp. MB09-02B TaxID=3028667 RepID=UPI0029AF7805|nr:beta-ketoacyl-[acyl-carrier-protein] synthase family protein [Streptomyces sp. MB09-02B]MDX3638425.1 beta-ketoacyl-[acyl-carrier-protein] synthase family protein [Streptomyces sp. MB09-02B]